MIIEAKYKFKYGTSKEHHEASDSLKAADTPEGIRNLVDKNPSLVPKFVMTYQDVTAKPENDFERMIADSISKIDRLTTGVPSLLEDGLPHSAIQVGYEEGFPVEVIADTLAYQGSRPNLSRLLVAPISQLNHPGEKDVSETYKSYQSMAERLKNRGEIPQTYGEATAIIRDLDEQLFRHLDGQRRRFGLTRFEYTLYLISSNISGREISIAPGVSQESLSQLVENHRLGDRIFRLE